MKSTWRLRPEGWQQRMSQMQTAASWDPQPLLCSVHICVWQGSAENTGSGWRRFKKGWSTSNSQPTHHIFSHKVRDGVCFPLGLRDKQHPEWIPEFSEGWICLEVPLKFYSKAGEAAIELWLNRNSAHIIQDPRHLFIYLATQCNYVHSAYLHIPNCWKKELQSNHQTWWPSANY